MRKLVSVKSDNTLDISIEEHLFENIRKAHNWYTNKMINLPAIFILGLIDVFGFRQIIDLTITDNIVNRFIIVTGLAIAFEIAPLYIGYSICLKCYHLGKRIHNWVLFFSCSACILGIISNIFFRYKTVNIAYVNPTTGEALEIGMPMTVLMCILPIITSLMSLVIGCLTFDPLQFELLGLSKKLARLKVRKQQMEAYLEELNDEETLKNTLEREEILCYEKVKQEIYTMQATLKTYAVIKTSSLYTINRNE